MSHAFRDLLRRVGSGTHTSKDLSREEAAAATCMMLQQEATPAQIGAFLIAHRIKRPTAGELAGMLDAYGDLGPQLSHPFPEPVMVLGCPYDGRSRTAPVNPVTALLLVAAGQPVVMHGGDRMPTKEGLPLVEIWQALDLPLHRLPLEQMQTLLASTGLGFVYLPLHFPSAHALVPYRDQIGKRPPLATIELMWRPCTFPAHVVTGFVHPPTETLVQETFALHHQAPFTTVKGQEGSCDLPQSRTAIIGLGAPDGSFERLLLHPRDYGFAAEDLLLENPAAYFATLRHTLAGQPTPLTQAAIWNGGFYLWRSGRCATIPDGFSLAETLLTQGAVWEKLLEIKALAGNLLANPVVRL